MGNKPNSNQKYTNQQLTSSLNSLLDDSKSITHLSSSLITIHHCFKNQLLFVQRSNKIHINPLYLKIVLHNQIDTIITKLSNSLTSQLNKISNKKTFLLISRQDMLLCLHISNFILIVGDQITKRQLFASNNKSFIDSQSVQVLESHQPYKPGQASLQNMNIVDLLELEEALRKFLGFHVRIGENLSFRSYQTKQVFKKLQESSFCLYALLALVNKQIHQKAIQNFKQIMSIASYFIAFSINENKGSLFEIAVIFLFECIKDLNKDDLVQMTALPPYKFPQLPIINTKSIYISTICYILNFLLKITNNKNKVQGKVSLYNQIPTYKLLLKLMSRVQQPNKQILYYLQKLCLEVKKQLIERSLLISLISKYITIDSTSKKLQQYITTNVIYNIKQSQNNYKIDCRNVSRVLNDRDINLITHLQIVVHKFMYENILNVILCIQNNSIFVWNNILPKLILDEKYCTDNKNQQIQNDQTKLNLLNKKSYQEYYQQVQVQQKTEKAIQSQKKQKQQSLRDSYDHKQEKTCEALQSKREQEAQ